MGRGESELDVYEALAEALRVPAGSGEEGLLVGILDEAARASGYRQRRDGAGNVLWERSGAAPAVAVVAHLDQVALHVVEVRAEGLVKVAAPGIDRRALPGLTVEGAGRRGVVVFRPPHGRDAETGALSGEDLYVDFGTSVPLAPGDVLHFARPPERLGRHRVGAAGLDNRASVAALWLAAARTEGAEVAHAFVFTVEEEAGRLGAAALMEAAAFDAAVVTDVTFGRAGGRDPRTFELGQGPCLGLGPNSDRRLFELAREAAAAAGIPVQVEVLPGDSGTDAWPIQVGGQGVPTLTASIPLRYMHSPGEVVDVRDVLALAGLVAALLRLPAARWEEALAPC